MVLKTFRQLVKGKLNGVQIRTLIKKIEAEMTPITNLVNMTRSNTVNREAATQTMASVSFCKKPHRVKIGPRFTMADDVIMH